MNNVPKEIKQISEAIWEIPTTYKEGMNVPARIIATQKLLNEMDPGVFEQVTNVACLPGIVGSSFALSDSHWGYGAPIGCVAAFDPEQGGVISPGINGFDLNCGMRLITTNLTWKDVEPKSKELVNTLFNLVPAGVGVKGFVKINRSQFKEVMEQGSKWCIDNNYGWKEDIKRTESYGKIDWADSTKVTEKALSRGINQLGTLGSGNHYLEVQVVKEENIHDEKLAKRFGIFPNQVVIMVHCLPGNSKVMTKYGAWIPIKDLENVLANFEVMSIDLASKKIENSPIIKFFKLKPHGKTFKITTKLQKEIIATEDHPILTERGLQFIKEFSHETKVAISPFDGVQYEKPTDEIIIGEDDLKKLGATEKIIKNLKEKGLLPLKQNSEKLPILIKILGFITGDGWLGKNKDRWTVKFIGNPEDLEYIKKDILSLKYKSNSIKEIYSKSTITQQDDKIRTIKGVSYQFSISSISLPMLLHALGAPFGNKSKTKFNVPIWLFNLPLWLKRLYLASYFGAEMSKPSTRKNEPYRFGTCKVSLNKIEELKINGYDFLNQIRRLLLDFGVQCGTIIEQKAIINKEDKRTIKLILQVSSKENNLKILWKNIGYEYNRKRSILAAVALQYLTHKNILLKEEVMTTGKSEDQLQMTSFRFRNEKYLTFEEFVLTYKMDPISNILWDDIEKIEEIKDFNEHVYDITVSHKDHTFIADNFVVGNCGSRGFGHQVATDYMRIFEPLLKKYNISIKDRELVCAPFSSKEGQDYYKAMACASNMAFANRQVILHRIREAFEKVFGQSAESMKMDLVYDVAHNIARFGEFKVNGKRKKLLVHRKGATQALGPGNENLAPLYRDIGQPVIIGGSMETGSYLLIGTNKAEEETFSSTVHGSGRTMSRTKAKNMIRGDKLQKDMEQKGIFVKAASYSGLAEEAGFAYKDLNEVVKSVTIAGISKPVVGLIPKLNVKG